MTAAAVLGSAFAEDVTPGRFRPETLATHPASMTHGDVPASQRDEAGVVPGLVRLSIGLEDPADVILDLTAALDAALDASAPAARAAVLGGAS